MVKWRVFSIAMAFRYGNEKEKGKKGRGKRTTGIIEREKRSLVGNDRYEGRGFICLPAHVPTYPSSVYLLSFS